MSGPGRADDPGPGGRRPILVGVGTPGLAVALAAPLVAVGLVAARASTSGLASTADDPAPPLLLAAVTVALALVVSYRALTQRAELSGDRLACRNLLVTFEVPWDRVERLERRQRGGVVTVDVVVRNLRRPHRVGAATRFAGDGAQVVVDLLRAHPAAGALLVDAAP